MRDTDNCPEPLAAQARVRALLHATAATHCGDPVAACAWPHSPHRLLLGATSASAAWYSERLAVHATALLAADGGR